jgi:hypothetical protein
MEKGFEPIKMQQRGGLLLATGNFGGNTKIKSNPSIQPEMKKEAPPR